MTIFLPDKLFIGNLVFMLMQKEKSCGIILFRKHGSDVKYLLLHYLAGHWDFSKGHVEENETEQETALRELKEETGIADAGIFPGFRHEVSYYFKQHSQTIFKEVVYFLAETNAKEVAISDEHIGYGWLSYENAMKKMTFRNSKDMLEKAHEFLQKNN